MAIRARRLREWPRKPSRPVSTARRAFARCGSSSSRLRTSACSFSIRCSLNELRHDPSASGTNAAHVWSLISSNATEDLMPTPFSPHPGNVCLTRRLDHEAPPVIAQLGWRYHHIGIPTSLVHAPETHLERFGLHVSGFSTSPYGVEWMRFEDDSPLHELIRTVPHVAFEVDDLDAALEGREVIYPPGSPSDGVRAAMIVHNGAPVELIWFKPRET